MNSQVTSDLRLRLVERHENRYNNWLVVERKKCEREEREDRGGFNRLSRPVQDANKHMEESRRNVRRKSESKRMKRKQMEKLQSKIYRKVKAGRSRSDSMNYR